jgi:hypothetical protein
MPLTEKGEKIKSAMTEEYGPEKGERVFYASKNKGTISGVDHELIHPGVETHFEVEQGPKHEDAWSPEAREAALEARRAHGGSAHGSTLQQSPGQYYSSFKGKEHQPSQEEMNMRHVLTPSQLQSHVKWARIARKHPEVFGEHEKRSGYSRSDWEEDAMPEAPPVATSMAVSPPAAQPLKDYARRAGMQDQPAGVMPTPTPTQSPTPNMPTPAQPTGQIPSPTPMTNPATVNAYGEIPGTNVGPTNRLVAGDMGRQVGTLRDYARAAGKR